MRVTYSSPLFSTLHLPKLPQVIETLCGIFQNLPNPNRQILINDGVIPPTVPKPQLLRATLGIDFCLFCFK